MDFYARLPHLLRLRQQPAFCSCDILAQPGGRDPRVEPGAILVLRRRYERTELQRRLTALLSSGGINVMLK